MESFRVKFQSSLKVGKLYVKMTLMTSAFQKKSHEVTRGHPRSKIPRIGQILTFYELRYQIGAIIVEKSKKVTKGEKSLKKVEKIELKLKKR